MATSRRRFDETWHRLREWTRGQVQEEMLAWQVIAAAGYDRIDPSHPHGGPDKGADALCERDGEKWVLAVYFARGEKSYATVKNKLLKDMEGAKARVAAGIVFVTNQELRLAEREKLEQLDPDLKVDIFHLLRIAEFLDEPRNARLLEDHLDIIAGPPPVLIRAEVSGTARAFLHDADVVDFLVDFHTEQVRKKSDEAWAEVRAKEAARARERQEAAEEARRKAAEAGNPMAAFGSLGGLMDFSSLMPDYSPGLPTPDSWFLQQVGIKETPPSKPLTDDEIAAETARYRAEIEGRWKSCQDYLAGVVWPGLGFKLENAEKSFLRNVQVILKFHGAVGIDYDDIRTFDWHKLEDPEWEPSYDGPDYWGVVAAPPPLEPMHLKDYPVKWRADDDGDLEVTITLPELRPRQVWRSDTDDVVLVVRDADINEVTVTYTVTAAEHHDLFEAEPITIPVERSLMLDDLGIAFKASKD